MEQARLGRNSSLDSWEDAEGGVKVGVGVEAPSQLASIAGRESGRLVIKPVLF